MIEVIDDDYIDYEDWEDFYWEEEEVQVIDDDYGIDYFFLMFFYKKGLQVM